MLVNTQPLCKFLVKAKKASYAAGEESKKVKERDSSTTLKFQDNEWKYNDNYFGGEPYGGREVVFFEGKPVYIMTYYGRVDKNIEDVKAVYKVLQQALLLVPESNPYRGPKKYLQGNYSYSNTFTGEIDNFFGEEMITLNGEEIYRAKYMGGLVDQRR